MDEEKTINTEETQESGQDTNDSGTDGGTDSTAGSENSEKAVRSAADEPAERTFTQSEVDEIIKKRIARAAKDTAAVTAENTSLRRSVACYKAGIKAESVEDAMTLAAHMVNDNTDFDAALLKVLEKYPNFGSTPQVKNSSVDMQPKKTDQSLSALRAAMGIREEKKK